MKGDVPRGALYDRRFEELAATGADMHGEATFVESYGPGSVLDAGCGTGRVAIELSRRGYEVVGIDLDPAMLEAARQKAPHLEWIVADLADPDLATPARSLGRRFDIVVMAGNVLIFVAPGTEGRVVANMAAHLTPGGILISGYSLTPGGLSVAEQDAAGGRVGLVLGRPMVHLGSTAVRANEHVCRIGAPTRRLNRLRHVPVSCLRLTSQWKAF